MLPVVCLGCGNAFIPKPMGFNARYCCDKCKRRAQRKRIRANKPEQLKNARKRSYSQTKGHPDRMARHRAGARCYRQDVRDWLAFYKLERGCYDCGYREHAAALQLDHEGDKTIEIADARTSIRALLEEIERGKCRVRCANCHSIRTWRLKQNVADQANNHELLRTEVSDEILSDKNQVVECVPARVPSI